MIFLKDEYEVQEVKCTTFAQKAGPEEVQSFLLVYLRSSDCIFPIYLIRGSKPGFDHFSM